MSQIVKFVPQGTLSDKHFYDLHLDAGETAQVEAERLYGPCWAVVTSYREPDTGMTWTRGEVRLSAQDPVRKEGRISRGWMRHFHPQNGFMRPGATNVAFWDLPEFTGEQNPEAAPVWRVNASGGYRPEAPRGYVVVSPTTMSSSSWLLMREDDPRIQEVIEY